MCASDVGALMLVVVVEAGGGDSVGGLGATLDVE